MAKNNDVARFVDVALSGGTKLLSGMMTCLQVVDASPYVNITCSINNGLHIFNGG